MDHAIERARVADAPLIPFVLTDTGATPEYHRFAGDSPDEGVELAAASSGPNAVARRPSSFTAAF